MISSFQSLSNFNYYYYYYYFHFFAMYMSSLLFMKSAPTSIAAFLFCSESKISVLRIKSGIKAICFHSICQTLSTINSILLYFVYLFCPFACFKRKYLYYPNSSIFLVGEKPQRKRKGKIIDLQDKQKPINRSKC